jgi:hypothetical protein
MERLKEDIDMKAQKFEHIDYYDALLRDGTSKEIAVATDEVHDFDARRKPLITVNPLFAKTSDLPPTPSVEDITFEHISLNLPNIAKNTLRELEDDLVVEQPISEENNEIESTNIESDIENNVESDDNILENQDAEIDDSDLELEENQDADDNSESKEKEENNDAFDEDEEDFSDEDENDDSESDNEDSEEEEDEENKKN